MSNKFQKFAQHNLCERKVESLRRKLQMTPDGKNHQMDTHTDVDLHQSRQDVESSSKMNTLCGRSLDVAKRFQKLKSTRRGIEEELPKNVPKNINIGYDISKDQKPTTVHINNAATLTRRREQLEQIKSYQNSKGMVVGHKNCNGTSTPSSKEKGSTVNPKENHSHDTSLRRKTLKHVLALKMIEEAKEIEDQVKKMKERKQQHVKFNGKGNTKQNSVIPYGRQNNSMKPQNQKNTCLRKKSELFQKKTLIQQSQSPIDKARDIIAKHGRYEYDRYHEHKDKNHLNLYENNHHDIHYPNDEVWNNGNGIRGYMDEIEMETSHDDGYSVQSSVLLNPIASVDRITHKFGYENEDRFCYSQQVHPNQDFYHCGRTPYHADHGEWNYDHQPYNDVSSSHYIASQNDSYSYYSDSNSFCSSGDYTGSYE